VLYPAAETKQQQEMNTVGLCWYEAGAHTLRALDSATLLVELLDSDGRVMGRIGPLQLEQGEPLSKEGLHISCMLHVQHTAPCRQYFLVRQP